MHGEFELAKGHLMPFAGGLLSVSIFASSLALVIMPEKKCLSKWEVQALLLVVRVKWEQ